MEPLKSGQDRRLSLWPVVPTAAGKALGKAAGELIPPEDEGVEVPREVEFTRVTRSKGREVPRRPSRQKVCWLFKERSLLE